MIRKGSLVEINPEIAPGLAARVAGNQWKVRTVVTEGRRKMADLGNTRVSVNILRGIPQKRKVSA